MQYIAGRRILRVNGHVVWEWRSERDVDRNIRSSVVEISILRVTWVMKDRSGLYRLNMESQVWTRDDGMATSSRRTSRAIQKWPNIATEALSQGRFQSWINYIFSEYVNWFTSAQSRPFGRMSWFSSGEKEEIVRCHPVSARCQLPNRGGTSIGVLHDIMIE